MIEVRGNLWTYPADVRVITTNGFVKKNGEAVMGRGCALEAKERFHAHGPDRAGISYPGLAKALGNAIRRDGNHVLEMITKDERDPFYLLTFPVKHHWHDRADVNLIFRSANELVAWANHHPLVLTIVMPRPGCGNGQLDWDEVRPILAPILDDRFHVITF